MIRCSWLTRQMLLVSLSGLALLLGDEEVSAQVVQAGATIGAPGDSVFFNVSLATASKEIAGVEHEISFSPMAPIGTNANGAPDCTGNPNVGGLGGLSVSSRFLPSGCSTNCTGIRAIVMPAGENLFSIPDGSTLYSCRVTIPPSTPNGTYPLSVTNPAASDPSGVRLGVAGTAGHVRVTTGCF